MNSERKKKPFKSGIYFGNKQKRNVNVICFEFVFCPKVHLWTCDTFLKLLWNDKFPYHIKLKFCFILQDENNVMSKYKEIDTRIFSVILKFCCIWFLISMMDMHLWFPVLIVTITRGHHTFPYYRYTITHIFFCSFFLCWYE
jgi:hypothetical protein